MSVFSKVSSSGCDALYVLTHWTWGWSENTGGSEGAPGGGRRSEQRGGKKERKSGDCSSSPVHPSHSPLWPKTQALSESSPPSFDYYFCALGFPAQFNVLLLTSWSNCFYKIVMAPLYGRVVKNPPAKAGDERDVALIPGLGRSPGGGNHNPLQYSCLKNSMDRGAWRATARGVAESDTTELHAPSVCPFALL